MPLGSCEETDPWWLHPTHWAVDVTKCNCVCHTDIWVVQWYKKHLREGNLIYEYQKH